MGCRLAFASLGKSESLVRFSKHAGDDSPLTKGAARSARGLSDQIPKAIHDNPRRLRCRFAFFPPFLRGNYPIVPPWTRGDFGGFWAIATSMLRLDHVSLIFVEDEHDDEDDSKEHP